MLSAEFELGDVKATFKSLYVTIVGLCKVNKKQDHVYVIASGCNYRVVRVLAVLEITPPYLNDLFQPIHKQHQHHTRLSNNGVLVPRAHTNMMSRSFHYTGAVMWNSLPDEIKAINRESTLELQ